MQDSFGNAHLNKLGEKEAKRLKGRLKKETKKDKDIHVYVSPLTRCRQTILPYLESRYDAASMETMKTKYEEIKTKFHALWKENRLLNYISDASTQKTFEI
jgi:broad specificity phosphatase PhoE